MSQSFEAVTSKFIEWTKLARVTHRDVLNYVSSKIATECPGIYAELFVDTIADFKTHLVGRQGALGFPRAHAEIDQWYFENVHKAGQEMVLLAVMYDHGVEHFLKVFDRVTAGPDEAVEAIVEQFQNWASVCKGQFAKELEAASAKIEAHGFSPYSEFFQEGVSAFKASLAQQAAKVFKLDIDDVSAAISKWARKNIPAGGLEGMMMAIIYDKGQTALEDGMEPLTPKQPAYT